MPAKHAFFRRLPALVLAVLLALLTLLSARTLQQEQLQSRHNLEKFHGLARLISTAANIETQIRESVKYSEFLAMLISRMPDMSDELLDEYAEFVLREDDNITGIQIAPGGVVSRVYPHEPHKIAIGHDLLADPQRRGPVLEAIETRQAVLQGPVQARQGGNLLFNRRAVFVMDQGEKRFWGLTVIAVDFDHLLARQERYFHDQKFLFALSMEDSKGARLLWGDQLPETAAPLRQKISLPHAEWELALLPRAGWSNTSLGLHQLNGLYYLFSLVLGLLAYISLQHYLAKAELSRRDPLTGVFNKRAAMQEIKRRLRRGQVFTLVIIDVNSFKQINDQLGHHVGDQVLIAVAQRIQAELRRSDMLVRLGGDEFAIFASGGEESATQLCERIAARIHAELLLDEHQLEVGISCGFACYPQDGHNSNALYEQADQRMYAYKREHKNGKAQTRFSTVEPRAERRS